jgi:ATP-dependent Clp protease ATP-binding subunit ClpC
MEEILNERIIGHKPLLADIAAVIRRNYAGFNGPRPIGSFLFLGPPGVGKTETAKTIASFLFHHDHAMLRIDMSEYQDAASVTRLIGAPPGYVGHDEGGQLTEAIRSKPYQLILLDEIEKAHRDVLMLLLQLLDEGTLTDGKGRKVSFSQCVVVMTSNLGSECCENISRGQIGFGRGVSSHPELKDQILESARNQLPLELWGRIDEHLVFAPLQEQEVRSIARLMVERSSKQLKDERNITYTVSERVLDWVILHGGYHPRWGARPMRSTIQRQLEASLAELILKGQARPGACLEAGLDEHGQLCWKMISNTPAVDSAPPAIDSSPPTRRRRSTAPTPPTGFASYSPEAEDDEAEFDLLALPLTH